MIIKRGKKAQGAVIGIMLIIVLVVAAVIILFSVVLNLTKQNKEVIDLKADLFKTRLDIADVSPVSESPSYAKITFSRGAEEVTLKNITIINKSLNVDVISVVDLSGSMSYCSNFTSSCLINKVNCENISTCKGIWALKINSAKLANKDFISQILINPKNNIGLVGYRDKVNQNDCHILSNNLTSLNNLTDSWIASGGTCISCGINESIERLKTSQKPKAIVVMTDGEANYCIKGYEILPSNCINRSAANETIEMARIAYQDYKIKVYTIGFGIQTYNTTLKAMAQVGNGTYSFADISGLQEIYGQIKEEIIKTYGAEKKYNHLKILFYTGNIYQTYNYYEPIPEPFETKEYTITIPGGIEYKNLTKIEIYMTAYTSDGKEIVGPLLSSFQVNK